MEIRLLAVDLDGTLLTSAKRISERTADAISAARGHGVRVVLASARPPRTVMPFYQQLALDTPMVNYNGALVIDPSSGRVLMHRPIPLKTTRQIVAVARETYSQVLVSAEIMDRWYTDRLDNTYLTETARLVGPDRVAPVDEWLTEAVTKLLLLGPPERLLEVAHAVRRRMPHQVSIVTTESHLLQLMHATVSKAQALRVVAAEYHLRREHVMAIGDNANDVGMLQWAGLSVAVATGAPEAVAAADYVTEGNDDEGVASAIRRFILHGRRE